MLKGYVANTDHDWFTSLRDGQPWEEVNFWQPRGGRGFHVINPGAPLIFRLKAPHNRIAGFGWFLRHEVGEDWSAWEAFGKANGAADFVSMRARIGRYGGKNLVGPTKIGCIMLGDPVFFPPDAYIAEPADWAPNIVSGKGYDLTTGEGARIWAECRERAGLMTTASGGSAAERFGAPVEVTPRLGQGSFRMAVIGAYGGACAVTKEHSLPVLEAAHIRPYNKEGAHLTSNGLLLRSDLHRLFDRGYITVTPGHVLRVSGALHDDYSNGATYYPLNGTSLHVPTAPADRPDSTLLEWHGDEVFRG